MGGYKKNRALKLTCIFMMILFLAVQSEVKAGKKKKFTYSYGVFLNADRKDMGRLKKYKTIVIDAQYFKKKDIRKLKKQGHTVYSYLNIGSLETFRPYYKKYRKYTLKPYENWGGEYWTDVSRKAWQNKIKQLADQLAKKGVDGFFVDNCDVYAEFPQKKIYRGVTKILLNLRSYPKKAVILNGGDTYVRRYYKNNRKLGSILTGVNQEEVFTRIDFKKKKLKKARAEDKKYFLDYLKLISGKKKKVYLLEYTKDPKLKKTIRQYCRKKHWTYYISQSADLGF
ncbi:endo alpha-1,4 polygalactosaminidase [Anaerostipes sp.]|uniref:endo alpha-1,4 polygalactosaminidase n=1 Tax=Anaerostipes sp. TaxID=1872530 RepID=UPI0025C4BE63|nr:endo alpha-1,4 polygalactosaminidase [Anaerostipes sp.]MBS7007849.1 endo alpha-1,4 polygalactosaminidase [Anaerostipes sp.]